MKVDVIELMEKYRVERKLSQTEMAELVGTSQPTYCRWRSGRAAIAAKYYKIIAKLFNLRLGDILPSELRDEDDE